MTPIPAEPIIVHLLVDAAHNANIVTVINRDVVLVQIKRAKVLIKVQKKSAKSANKNVFIGV